LSIKTIINLNEDFKILKTVKSSIETDLDLTPAGVLARMILSAKNNMKSYVLSTDLLVSPPVSATYDKQYVLIPKAGNGKWQEIIKWVSSILN